MPESIDAADPAMPPEPRKAATVVVVRPGPAGLEVLLLRRNAGLAFAGGLWVFPGGALDAGERAIGQGELQALRMAGAREAREEAGIEVDPDELIFLNHWTTPVVEKRRFSTWFFVHVLKDDQPIEIDDGEIKDHLWISPGKALEMHWHKELGLYPPTLVTLLFLSHFSSDARLLEGLERHEPQWVLPIGARMERGVMVMLEGDAGYSKGEPTAGGARHCVELHDGVWNYIRDGVPAGVMPLVP